MKEGRKRYIAELRKQLATLQELCAGAEAGMTRDAAVQLYRLVHTLRGSAPMFGFMRIGEIADKLVRQWEWTQAQEGLSSADMEFLNRFKLAVSEGDALVRQLSVELDIYNQELDLDEKREQAAMAGTALSSGSRLLIIDDDEALRSYLVRRLILEGYQVDGASDVAEAQKLLRQFTYDLITLDLMMHPQSGYELFAFVKEDPTLKWVPLVVLSGRSDVHDKVRCFYLGADDYMTKPFQYEELSARIYSLLKRTKDFERMAFRDPLTGVYNRRFFDHQIQAELQRIQRYPSPISLAFIDIDRFKSINDTHGHHIGDLVLQGLAHLLQHHLRETDVLARFGGEEFVIVLPGSSGDHAQKTIESILRQTHAGPVAQHEGEAYRITFSAGVCEWTEGMTVAEWIKRADNAMYTAKQSGRDRVILYTGQLSDSLSDASSAPEPGAKTVLIADDDRILRSILVSKLQHLPVTFVEAEDGEEAYRVVTTQSVDVCILDGVMPRLDGLGMLNRLHTNNMMPSGLQVLMLSGRGREEDMSKGAQLGVNVYMSKPFSMLELEFKVKQMLGLPD
ncbi:diguanylate cyclase [Paenibacillus piri]|uniref:Diguanylate cyclase n=1 Tax=Paenibacillus piri TaxID=2547395 RepID=A0A4R5KWJ5_9BACL|nr:diguanylate cyclase [Paenibacillus piri]TDG00400.1 diguanylate cyclase [Paenibacillus piri]